MKWLAAAVLLSTSSALACWPPQDVRFSTNGQHALVMHDGGTSYHKGGKLTWHQSFVLEGNIAIADDGSLIVCVSDNEWTVLTGNGEMLSRHFATPGIWPPLRFLVDQARTCWRTPDAVYIEFSQGDVYTLRSGQWRAVSPAEVLASPNTPRSVRAHLREASTPGRELSTQVWQDWISSEGSELARFSEPGTPLPLFRNLSPRSLERLESAARLRYAPALLALGLGGYRQHREQLLQIANEPVNEATAAQRALILLDEEAAAPALLPALRHSSNDLLLDLFARVPCGEAVPMLIRSLSWNQSRARRALVAQTRIDLGSEGAAWERWLRGRRPGQVPADDSSSPLWLAQRENSKLSEALATQPPLVALFDLPCASAERVAFVGRRLARTRGNTTYQRILEWDLESGQALVTAPKRERQTYDFLWNPQQEILLASSATGDEIIQSGVSLFSQSWSPGPIGSRLGSCLTDW